MGDISGMCRIVACIELWSFSIIFKATLAVLQIIK